MEVTKKLGFKRFAIIFLSVILITTGFVWASDIYIDSTGITGTSIDFSDVTNPPTQPYSFLIGVWPNGTYYAQNGTDGSVSWSSTNQNTVTSNALTATGALTNGGAIYLENLQFNRSLTIPAKVLVIQHYNGLETRYTSDYQGGYTITPTGASKAPYVSGWDYPPIEMTISKDSTLSDNNQLQVITHYGYGVNSNASFYLQNNSRTDFGDVRFLTLGSYNADPTDPWLPQWNQTYFLSDNATWWFKDPDNLYAKDSIVYLYSGNSTATNPSNQTAVFIDVIPNLILALPMTEGAGTTANDYSGNSNDAQFVGTGNTWANGPYSYADAVSMNGSGYLNTYADLIKANDTFSVLAWINHTQNGYQAIVAEDDLLGANRDWELDINNASANRLMTRMYDGANVAHLYYSADNSVPTNSWMQVGLMWSNSSLNFSRIINATAIVLESNVASLRDQGANTTIGYQYSSTYNFFGSISYPLIFQRELTSINIQNIFNYFPDATLDNGKVLVRTIALNTSILENTQIDTFSIIQIGDTQKLTAYSSPQYSALTNWIANQSTALNLKAVIHTGDIVELSTNASEYVDANTSMNILYNANIPYLWTAGNHDQFTAGNPNGTWYGTGYSAFNATLMSARPYWESSLNDGKNTAIKFTFNGHVFLIIDLEYLANSSTITWMTDLFNANPNANIIVGTHSYRNNTLGFGLTADEAAWGTAFNTTLNGYSNVFLVVSGHVNDQDTNTNMTSINGREEILFNYQPHDMPSGAATARIYTFDISALTCTATTYEVYDDTWVTDAYNQFSFNLPATFK